MANRLVVVVINIVTGLYSETCLLRPHLSLEKSGLCMEVVSVYRNSPRAIWDTRKSLTGQVASRYRWSLGQVLQYM